ncbi:MAG: DUF4142 domain-containing protein [Pseudomonadota bacterium]
MSVRKLAFPPAIERGTWHSIVRLWHRMLDDHTRALADVTALAQNKGVNLPAAPDAKSTALVGRLGRLKGERFDRAYMAQAGVADHQQAYPTLKRGEARARDPDVKALAAPPK